MLFFTQKILTVSLGFPELGFFVLTIQKTHCWHPKQPLFQWMFGEQTNKHHFLPNKDWCQVDIQLRKIYYNIYIYIIYICISLLFMDSLRAHR